MIDGSATPYLSGQVQNGGTCNVCLQPVNLSDRTVDIPCGHKIHKQCYEKKLNNINDINEINSINNRRPGVICPSCHEPALIQSTFWANGGYKIHIKKSELTGPLPYVGDPVVFTLQDGSEVIVALGFKKTPCLHAGPVTGNNCVMYAYVTDDNAKCGKVRKTGQPELPVDTGNEEEINSTREGATLSLIRRYLSSAKLSEINSVQKYVFKSYGFSNICNESTMYIFSSPVDIKDFDSGIVCINHPFTPLRWRSPITGHSVCQKRKITNDSPVSASTRKKTKLSSELFARAFEDPKLNKALIAQAEYSYNRIRLKITITSEDNTDFIATLSNNTFKDKKVSALFSDAYVMDGLKNQSSGYPQFQERWLSFCNSMKADDSIDILIQQEIDPV
ncbi:RING finger protein [Endozoicomonas sp.]|uniref:RING finger protein n=1 Tax=Endozoicomonas sp. TaxID=1892382 RepID=UPI003839FD85